MREREVHPAVLVEIECHNANSRRKIFVREIDRGQRSEFSFARIQENRGAPSATSKNKINGAVVVEVGDSDAGPGRIHAKAGFFGNVGEGRIAVIAPQFVFGLLVGGGFRCHGEIQIEVAVMVVVNKGGSDAAFFSANSNSFGYLDKFTAAFIVEQANARGLAHGQIGPAVVVEIACGAAKARANSR